MINVYENFNLDNPKWRHYLQKKINLNGKVYTVTNQIGGGGESYVFEISEDIEGVIPHALKVCKGKNKRNKEGEIVVEQERFAKEILVAKEFSAVAYKNNFITYVADGYLDFYNEKQNKTTSHSYYIMELAEEHLEDYLCSRMNWSDEREILPKMKELANTLKKLHEKDYVHRDIKPQNVLVQGELFKLADFGMVEKENESCTKSGPKYWPTPELLNMCDEDVHCSGKQTDVFMLGCIFYFIYTKKYPVGNIDIDLIDQSFKMRPIIEKMISYQTNDRHNNGEEVYAEISQIRFD